MKNVCFISYIVNRPDFYNFFSEFSKKAEKYGYEMNSLHIGRTAIGKAPIKCTSLPYSANIAYYMSWSNHRLEEQDFPEYIKTAANFEIKRLNAAEKRKPKLKIKEIFHTILYNYSHFIRAYLLRTQPEFVILGHQYECYYHISQEICEELKIPILFYHPGVITGTANFEFDGQMAESELLKNKDKYLNITLSKQEIDKTKIYIERAKQGVYIRPGKPKDNCSDTIKALDHYRRIHKKIVLYAGNVDFRTGIIPRSYKNSKLHSSWLDSTEHGLDELLKIAEKEDFYILFKPHPLAIPICKNKLIHSRVSMISDITLSKALEYSDIFCTICSSGIYEALIREKPSILMGSMQASLIPSVYKSTSPDSLKTHIIEGIKQGWTPKMTEDLENHIGMQLFHYLYSENPKTKDIMSRDSDYFWKTIESKIQDKYPSLLRPYSSTAKSIKPLRPKTSRLIRYFLKTFTHTFKSDSHMNRHLFWDLFIFNYIPKKYR